MRDPNTGKSRGFAYVNFCNPRDAEQARLVAQHEKLGRKYIRIMYKRQNIKGLNEANVFVKNIDKHATIKDLHSFMSQIGTVISAKLAVDQKGESLGYGYVQFEKPDDVTRAINELNGAKFKEQNIEVIKFVPRSEREPKKKNNLYIKHLPDMDEKELENKIDEIFGKFGEISDKLIRKDPKIGKYFAFLCYKEGEAAQKAVEHFHNNPVHLSNDPVPLYVNFSQTRQERDEELRRRRAEASNQNNLYMKNLKPTTTKEALKELFLQYGEVVSCDVKRWDNPSNTKNAHYGFVAFKTPDEATKAMNSAHENEDVKKLFIDDRPIINIFQNREQRSKFLSIQHRQRFTMPQFPPQFGANPEMQRQIFNPTRKFPPLFPLPYGGMGGNQPMPGGPNQPFNRGPQMNKRPGGQGRPPFMGGQGPRGPRPQQQGGMGGAPQMREMRGGPGQQQMPFRDQNRGQRPPQQQRPDQGPKQAQQQPLSQEQTKPQQQQVLPPVASTITVADLKNKWADFIKLDKDKQRNILGEILYPLIKERVGDSLAPKITGMLIDLDVLEITEIFEFLEDRDLLHERIEEAKQLILSENA